MCCAVYIVLSVVVFLFWRDTLAHPNLFSWWMGLLWACAQIGRAQESAPRGGRNARSRFYLHNGCLDLYQQGEKIR